MTIEYYTESSIYILSTSILYLTVLLSYLRFHQSYFYCMIHKLKYYENDWYSR